MVNFFNFIFNKNKINITYFIFNKNLNSFFNINLKNSWTSLNNLNNFNLYKFFGIKYIISFINKIFIFLLIAIFIFFFLIFFKDFGINKIFFLWFCLFMLIYWLISNFVFFFKKYQYGKFTSVIQRFWRRSLLLFWILELFLFSIFLFLTLNSSNEPFHMFDQQILYKTFLIEWIKFFKKLYFYIIFLILIYITLILLKFNNTSTQIFFIFFITLFLIFFFFSEFYQFFHVYQLYNNKIWIYKDSLNIWTLENDEIKTRSINHYIFLLTVLKFWHIIFILFFWIFFLSRTIETEKITYPLYSSNIINFIFLFIFLFLMLLFWIKFIYKKYYDYSYFWFFLNPRHIFFKIFFNDYKIIFNYLLNNIEIIKNYLINNNFFFFKTNFFYFNNSSNLFNFTEYKMHFIKNIIIKSLKSY